MTSFYIPTLISRNDDGGFEAKQLLVVRPEKQKKTYKNVLVGEVWLCSGQSNMAFRVDQSVKEELEASLRHAATSPQIRLFDMQPRWYTNDVEWETSVLDSLNR